MPSNATPPPATAEQYASLLERLLPPGPIWILQAGAELLELFTAAGAELVRVHNRGLTLLDDADPRTASELLPDFERVLNLPDPVLGVPATLGARQAIAWARWAAQGGQTAAYFIGIARSLGLTVTISEPCQPFRAGSRAGTPCWSASWAYGWIVFASNGSIATFCAGSRAGYRLHDARQPALEALIWRYAPAHTIPVFIYSP